MNKKTDKLKRFRLFILEQINDLSPEQLNKIPQGFNNNIIWNLGHMLSASQALCYRRSGITPAVDEKYITPFLTGTKPGNFIPANEIAVIKELLIRTTDILQADMENKQFEKYTKPERIEAVYGVELRTIDDALEFLLYHEGVHSGCIMELKRVVQVID